LKSGQSRRRTTGLAAAVVVVVVVILVIVAAIYVSSNAGKGAATPTATSTTGGTNVSSTITSPTISAATTMTTSTTTATAISDTSTTISDDVTPSSGPLLYSSGLSAAGLQLRVMLNSSTAPSHGAFGVQIELVNTLDQNVSLSVPLNQNISKWNQVDFLCATNPSRSLAGFALFQGHFSPANISGAGSPLQLAEIGFEPPCLFSPALTSTTFLPNSDNTESISSVGPNQEPPLQLTAEVNATTGYCTRSGQSTNCGGSLGLFGYWNPALGSGGNGTLSSKEFAYLPSGEYTLVAADDWNQYVYAYLMVMG
jgi:hypothetical protein